MSVRVMPTVIKKSLWALGALFFSWMMMGNLLTGLLIVFEVISEKRHENIYFIKIGLNFVLSILGLVGSLWAGRHLFQRRAGIKSGAIAVSLLLLWIFYNVLTHRTVHHYLDYPLLFREASVGNARGITFMVSHGANPDVEDKEGQTALMIASVGGYGDVVETLVKHKADVNKKHQQSGITALMLAAAYDHPDVVRILLDNGAQIDAKDDSGWTALIHAASYGHSDTVRTLLNRGADANAKNSDSHTALSFAALEGHTDTVKALLDGGSAIDSKDDNGRTALMLAAAKGHTEAAKLLLSRGADYNAKDKDNHTALNWATVKSHSDIVELLKQAGAKE